MGADPLEQLIAHLGVASAVRVVVESVHGSGPREAGAWMAVLGERTIASIGGGHLEFDAIAHARRLLAGEPVESARRVALGPSLGQCCGGVVQLRFERLTGADVPRLRIEQAGAAQALMPVALFGGGHVGRALVQLLGALPVRVHWIDSRDEIFPEHLPARVHCEHSDPVQAAVPTLAAGSRVLVMSFSHAEDLDIVAACLVRSRARGDLPYVGLIGSKSKWAAFRHRLEARGFKADELARVTSPIGVAGIVGKEPEVIALAVAAQLMQQRGPIELSAAAA